VDLPWNDGGLDAAIRRFTGAVVGKHRTSIHRTGLHPNTKEGELALVWAVSGPPSSEANVASDDGSCFSGMP
jgi:hypothetical protein